MTTSGEHFKARSWLFAPGDSERKMEKATAGSADIVLFDLEDAVAPEEKPKARTMVRDFLKAQSSGHERLWVRINPLDGPHAVADLAAIVPGRPGGIMLPKARGRADVELLDHYLTALEVANGIEQGSIKVIALVTETAEAMFTTGDYKGAPRLVAMTWGAEDLADALERQRESQSRRQLRVHLSAGAQPVPDRRSNRRRAADRDDSGRFQGSRRSAQARRASASRRLSRHAGDPSGAGRRDQRGIHAERRGNGGGAGDRRSVRRQSGCRRDRPQGRHARSSVPRARASACSRWRDVDDGQDRCGGLGPQSISSPWRSHRLGPGLRRADDAGRGADRASREHRSPVGIRRHQLLRHPDCGGDETVQPVQHGRDRRAAHGGCGRPPRHRAVSCEPGRADDRAGSDRLRRRLRAGQPGGCRRQSQLRSDQRPRAGRGDEGAGRHRRGQRAGAVHPRRCRAAGFAHRLRRACLAHAG